MTTTNTNEQTPETTKPKQATPCERATKANERAQAATKLARKLAGKDPDPQTARLVQEADLHAGAAVAASETACDESVPYARRLTASGRAKLAADSAEGAAGEIKAAQDKAAADADDALLEQLESTPGYTKNPEWLAVQARIEARRF